MATEKPHAPATARNREPILTELRALFDQATHVLEIGSGTGEHAVHFAAALPHLRWQPSDVPANLPGIAAWRDDAALANLLAPIALDVTADWPATRYDAVFSANTLHIMSWAMVEATFRGLPGVLLPGAVVAIYGPFNVDGQFTSESNAAFDASLRATDPARGLRDVATVDALARVAGLEGLEQRPMPSNNRLLVWRYGASQTFVRDSNPARGG